MTPSFALSLSYEGIRLLHRAAGGWQRVGDVPLTVEDLSASLRVLKKTATALHASALRTKLIIPTEQIRFLKIETGEQDLATRRSAAEQALDGVTPYDIPDLSIDVLADGPITYVAAVARETLAEAETFAVQHGFDPVSFVASPDPDQFAGEPFFGPTIHAASILEPGEFVSRDRAPVTAYAPQAPVEPNVTAPVSDSETADIEMGAIDDDISDSKDQSHAEDSAAHASAAPDEGAELQDMSADVADVSDDGDQALDQESAAPEGESDPQEDDWALSKIIEVSEAKDVQSTPVEIAELAESDPQVTASSDDEGSTTLDKFPFDTEPDEATFEFAEDPVPFEAASKTPDAQSFDEVAEVAEETAAFEPEQQLEQEPARHTEPDLELELEPEQQPEPELYAESELEADASFDTVPEPDPEPQPVPEPETPLVAQFSTRRNPDNKAPKLGGVTRADAPPLDDVAPDTFAELSAPVEKPPVTIIRNEDAVESDRFSAGSRAAGLAAMTQDLDADVDQSAPGVSSTPDEKRLLDEADRLTVFGARQRGQDMDGRPKLLGIVLGVLLMVFLVGVASWSTVFSDGGLASLFDDRPEAVIAEPVITEPALPIVTPEALPTETAIAPTVEDPAPETELASLQPELTDEDAAVLDALTDARPEPAGIGPQTADEQEADYAVTGIWATAPTAPEPVSIVTIDDIYQTSIDPGSNLIDAIALAPPPESETALLQIPSPAAPGISYDLDERGLVKPTPEGAATPDGVVVFSGPPPVKPPVTPERRDVVVQPTVAVGSANSALQGIRPRLRPAQLIENNERTALGGSSLAELASFRPVLRPAVTRTPEQQRTEIDDAIAIAMATSVRPKPRTRNVETIAARATPAPAAAPAAAAAPEPEPTRVVRSIAPRTVTPSVPTSASVTRQATLENAINLRKVNLIGVFGKPSERRALVRMPNGRYKKVQVGDSLDGGRVSAIGDSELRYSKGARNVVLRMPRG